MPNDSSALPIGEKRLHGEEIDRTNVFDIHLLARFETHLVAAS